MDELVEIPGGIDRLRSTVLSLAFTGKLVQQDASEGSADEVIRQLEKYHAAQAKKGKAPHFPDIDPDSAPYQLPESWRWVRLAQLCSHIVDCQHRTPVYSDTGVPAIRTADMKPGRIVFETARRVGPEEYKRQTARLEPEPGDIFYSREGNYGIAAVVPDGHRMCLSQRMMQFRVGPGVAPSFFSWGLNSPIVFDQAKADVIGTTVPHINIRSLKNYLFPLAPEAEQLRIVQKVDEIFTLIDQLVAEQSVAEFARQRLSSATLRTLGQNIDAEFALEHLSLVTESPDDVKRLAVSILDLAVRGQLSVQDTTESSPIDPSESDLSLLPYPVPSNWGVTKVRTILEDDRDISYGVIKLGVEPLQGGVPTLRCSDVKPRRLELSAVRRVDPEIEKNFARTRLVGGEVVINVRGTLGGVARVPDELAGYNVAREVAVVPVGNAIDPDFLVSVFASGYFWDLIQASLRGIAYVGLNLRTLREMPIPVPPLEEQRRIVATLDELLGKCDQLQAQVQDRTK
ncbi:restriction endonuclease subunit S [Lentzea sp. NPDC060358]|uniref:restriction endonuclease subunit S n=1 Tax=Lentzea sp. NPDC060358 TaxID=3347103 RepID=UPI003658FF70